MKRMIGQAKRKAARLARMAALWARAKLAALWRKSKAVAMSLATACALTLPALASDGGGSGSGSGSGSLTSIVSATDTVTAMVGQAWTLMTSNELLRVYVAAGLLSVGIGFFGYLKRQSRH